MKKSLSLWNFHLILKAKTCILPPSIYIVRNNKKDGIDKWTKPNSARRYIEVWQSERMEIEVGWRVFYFHENFRISSPCLCLSLLGLNEASFLVLQSDHWWRRWIKLTIWSKRVASRLQVRRKFKSRLRMEPRRQKNKRKVEICKPSYMKTSSIQQVWDKIKL